MVGNKDVRPLTTSWPLGTEKGAFDGREALAGPCPPGDGQEGHSHVLISATVKGFHARGETRSEALPFHHTGLPK